MWPQTDDLTNRQTGPLTNAGLQETSEWSCTCMWGLWSLVAAESRNPQWAWAAEENPLAERREKEDKGRKKVGWQINSLFFSASKSYSFGCVYHYQIKSRSKRGCWCWGGCTGWNNCFFKRFHVVESHISMSFWIQSKSSCHMNTEKVLIHRETGTEHIQKLFFKWAELQ